MKINLKQEYIEHFNIKGNIYIDDDITKENVKEKLVFFMGEEEYKNISSDIKCKMISPNLFVPLIAYLEDNKLSSETGALRCVYSLIQALAYYLNYGALFGPYYFEETKWDDDLPIIQEASE
ncbi:hypothetical protein [Brochothrix thermosphacta]|uniref:hypothetical protein n=1 Tax=Brochothrix thermosphacta TaxID=2756 RepID=UPI00083FA5A6|nr:hypothetical protein [Brochothrix thermosphacta]ODJ63264.1 hypothetical protein BFR35_01405 [Brochothrix thermosphacta]